MCVLAVSCFLLTLITVLDLSFTGDSPQLGVGTVNAELFTNRPGVQIMCFLHRTTFSQDCKHYTVCAYSHNQHKYFLPMQAPMEVSFSLTSQLEVIAYG